MTTDERTALIKHLYHVNDEHVYGFFLEHRYLSNFHKCSIIFEGNIYGSTEAAYQAAKTKDHTERIKFELMEPSQAKREGQKVNIRSDWGEVKVQIMEELVRRKFNVHEELRMALIETGDRYLEETNYWGDRFWGSDLKHQGQNHLGKILMKIRDELRHVDSHNGDDIKKPQTT